MRILPSILIATCLTFLTSFGYAAEEAAPAGLYPVTLKELEGSVSRALQEKGAGDVVNAYIIGKRTTVMYHTAKPVELQVKTVEFDPAAGKWSANILFVAGKDVLTALPFSGRYDEMKNIPVVKKPLHAGDVINKEDIVLQPFAKSRIRQSTVTEAEALVGKSPRRAISASRPIRLEELQNPRILRKGAVVEMRYNTPYMSIKTLGEAMTEGAAGDVIAVRNQTSRKIVQATIISASEVRVAGEGEQIASPSSSAAQVNAAVQEPVLEEDPYNEKL